MATTEIIPSRKWYPQDLAGQAVWWQNHATQFAVVGPDLGFSPAEIADVQDDNTVVQFLAETMEQLDAFEKAVRQYRDIIMKQPVGEPTPAFPANPAFALPEVVPTGINQRLNERVRRYREAPAYTEEIGALLGTIPTGSGPTPESETKPVIKAFESLGLFMFKLRVVKDGMPAFKVQISRMDSADVWTDAAFATTSPVTVTVVPTTPGQPERINVRIVLLKDNLPVGVPSDVIQVTINP
jgi:hypothetical protein